MSSERSTIVKRLINGEKGVPGIPVVWGISATVERFNKAMEGAQGRSTLPHVTVDAARVQDSGLLKDTIVLDIPDEAGDFDTVLVRRAADKLRDSTKEWATYAQQQHTGETVLPLMVLQVPNTPNPNDIGRTLDPENENLFTWWPPWRSMKERNIGWRIDYVLTSTSLAATAHASTVQREVGTSDHGPVVVTFG